MSCPTCRGAPRRVVRKPIPSVRPEKPAAPKPDKPSTRAEANKSKIMGIRYVPS